MVFMRSSLGKMSDILYCFVCDKFMMTACSHNASGLSPQRYSVDKWGDQRRTAKKQSADYKALF